MSSGTEGGGGGGGGVEEEEKAGNKRKNRHESSSYHGRFYVSHVETWGLEDCFFLFLFFF